LRKDTGLSSKINFNSICVCYGNEFSDVFMVGFDFKARIIVDEALSDKLDLQAANP